MTDTSSSTHLRADPLVCLLGPLALTGPQLDYIEDRRREGGAERRSQHEVVMAILGEADWAIPIPEERPRTHYQTQGELRIPPQMIDAAYEVSNVGRVDDMRATAEEIHRRINDVLCWAIDDALGDGQQDGP